jgi:predicted transcriptional regulator
MAHRLTLRLTDQQKIALDIITQRTGLNFTEILRRSLDEYVDRTGLMQIVQDEWYQKQNKTVKTVKKRKLKLAQI